MTRIALAAVLVALSLAARAADLEVGSAAPDWTLAGSDGKSYTQSQFKGKGVVLAWFPKAFTPGCTAELAALRDSAAELAKFEAAVFMVSLDTPEKNAEFAKSLGADLVLLSDSSGKTASAFGVAALGGAYAKRWTFYVDPDGVIRAIDKNVRNDQAGQDIATRLGELGFPRR